MQGQQNKKKNCVSKLDHGWEFVLTYMFCSFPLFPRKCMQYPILRTFYYAVIRCYVTLQWQ